jgi:two-component system, NarL family, response regulator NreC
MDYRMPKVDGLRASRIITEILPETRIIMVSAEDTSEFMFNAIESRVSGIVTKTSSEAELLQAISDVMSGKPYLNISVSNKITEHLYEKAKKRLGDNQAKSLLTNRELEVLNLLVKGYSASQISGKLIISRRTVEAHKANMLKKCQVATTPDLIRFAISKNLIGI